MDVAVTIRGSSSKKLLVFHFVKSQLLVLLWFVILLVFTPHSSTSLKRLVIAEAGEWCICRSVCYCVSLSDTIMCPAKR